MSIPKIIHYCWFGGNDKPAIIKKCIKSWKKYCPDYEIIEWNESNFDVNCIDFCRQAYQAKRWAFVTDYVRLKVLQEHGGIYMDTDVELVKPLDTLLDKSCFMGFQHENFVATGLILGAEPENWFVRENARIYEQMDNDRIVNNKYGICQEYTTRILKEHGLKLPCTGEIQKIDGVYIYPPEYFCPYDIRTYEMHRTKNTYAIHRFASSWWTAEDRKRHAKEKRAIRFDRALHAPHRLLRKWLGDSRYEAMKKAFRG